MVKRKDGLFIGMSLTSEIFYLGRESEAISCFWGRCQ